MKLYDQFFLCSILFISINSTAAELLKPYNIDSKQVTISGISSGAFMAEQMAVAYSKTFSGMASIAGGIFWCSQGSSQKAQTECMGQTSAINPSVQLAYARDLEARGEIDSLANLKNHRIFLFASPKDTIIKPPSSDKLYEFIKAFTPEDNIVYEKNQAFAHGFPTLNYGASCSLGFMPWLLKCNYDTAREIFKTFQLNQYPSVPAIDKNLTTYDQSEFGNAQTPLFDTGWIYVPEKCAQGEKCALHVALHGCQMNPEYIQDQFAKNAGYNSWAEANNVIVLYPQSAKMSGNPYACWDWFGFTGENFVTRSGSQMKALKAMIDRLMTPVVVKK